jgi:MFS family permease
LISTVTAIYDIGCFFGALLVIAIGDPLGRKKCVLLGTTIMSIGAILQIAAFGVPQMIVGRIIAGIGNGINTSTGMYMLSRVRCILLTTQHRCGRVRPQKLAGEANSSSSR